MIEKLSDLAFSDNEENVKLCDMLQKSLGVSVFKWFKIGYGNGNGNRYGDGYGNGFGFGKGFGFGDGKGDGFGDGKGDGFGDGFGDGNGFGKVF